MKEPEIDFNEITGGKFIEIPILKDTAERLFTDKQIRFSFNEAQDEMLTSMKIIIEERLTLFFYKKDGKWKYDGWEMGDYNNYWTKGAI